MFLSRLWLATKNPMHRITEPSAINDCLASSVISSKEAGENALLKHRKQSSQYPCTDVGTSP